MEGYWEDYELHPDGRRVLVRSGRNMVMNTAYVVMAALLKRDATYGNGFLYWAVGDGNTTNTATWDAGVAAGTTVPAPTETHLLRETYRKAVQLADIEYVDSGNNTSATPTNRLRVTMTLGNTEPAVDSDLREWGLFAGNAGAGANTGLMVNHKVHATYRKQTGVTLQRVLYFTL
jgi:hypothetical protein